MPTSIRSQKPLLTRRRMRWTIPGIGDESPAGWHYRSLVLCGTGYATGIWEVRLAMQYRPSKRSLHYEWYPAAKFRILKRHWHSQCHTEGLLLGVSAISSRGPLMAGLVKRGQRPGSSFSCDNLSPNVLAAACSSSLDFENLAEPAKTANSSSPRAAIVLPADERGTRRRVRPVKTKIRKSFRGKTCGFSSPTRART